MKSTILKTVGKKVKRALGSKTRAKATARKAKKAAFSEVKKNPGTYGLITGIVAGGIAGKAGKKRAVKRATEKTKSRSIALNTTANISKTLTDMGVKPTYKNFKKYVNSPTFRKKFNKRAESNRKAIRNFEPKGMVIKFN